MVELDSGNVCPRLAELQMSAGYLTAPLMLRNRLNSNRIWQGLRPYWDRRIWFRSTQWAARTARAVELDQSDPMPRLGMGLAKIREGHLEAGRIDIEIAASAPDPANSLTAILEKHILKRGAIPLQERSLIWQKNGPNDPTPWLYDGIMKQTQNQPVQALRDIQKSIELNG